MGVLLFPRVAATGSRGNKLVIFRATRKLLGGTGVPLSSFMLSRPPIADNLDVLGVHLKTHIALLKYDITNKWLRLQTTQTHCREKTNLIKSVRDAQRF